MAISRSFLICTSYPICYTNHIRTLKVFFVVLLLSSIGIVNPLYTSYAEAPNKKDTTDLRETTIKELIRTYGEKYNADIGLANALVSIESSICRYKTNPNSSAKGCFQVIDSTWKHFKCVGDPMNDKDNIECAMRMLGQGLIRHWLVDPNTKRKLADYGYYF